MGIDPYNRQGDTAIFVKFDRVTWALVICDSWRRRCRGGGANGGGGTFYTFPI